MGHDDASSRRSLGYIVKMATYSKEILNPKNISIDLSRYAEYIFSLDLNEIQKKNLLLLRDTEFVRKVVNLAGSIFREEINIMTNELKDPSVGIGSIDIPLYEKITKEDNAFYGAVIAHAISQNIFTSEIDSTNRTPFTLYTASQENERKLRQANLDFNSLNDKLGFHVDGTLKKTGVEIPLYIYIYNIFISYQNPGNFHWVTTSQWTSRDQYIEKLGTHCEVEFSPTPIVYEDKVGTLHTRNMNTICTPLFRKNNNKDYIAFLNGSLKCIKGDQEASIELLNDLRNSIATNKTRYSIEQRSRRAIFLGNSLGYHARDIFEQPINKWKYTRAYLRSVSQATL